MAVIANELGAKAGDDNELAIWLAHYEAWLALVDLPQAQRDGEREENAFDAYYNYYYDNLSAIWGEVITLADKRLDEHIARSER